MASKRLFENSNNTSDLTDKILKNSGLSEEDAEEIGHKIKAEIRKRFEKRFGK